MTTRLSRFAPRRRCRVRSFCAIWAWLRASEHFMTLVVQLIKCMLDEFYCSIQHRWMTLKWLEFASFSALLLLLQATPVTLSSDFGFSTLAAHLSRVDLCAQKNQKVAIVRTWFFHSLSLFEKKSFYFCQIRRKFLSIKLRGENDLCELTLGSW